MPRSIVTHLHFPRPIIESNQSCTSLHHRVHYNGWQTATEDSRLRGAGSGAGGLPLAFVCIFHRITLKSWRGFPFDFDSWLEKLLTPLERKLYIAGCIYRWIIVHIDTTISWGQGMFERLVKRRQALHLAMSLWSAPVSGIVISLVWKIIYICTTSGLEGRTEDRLSMVERAHSGRLW